MNKPTFADLGLSDTALKALEDTGYSHPTEIQALAIPVLLRGRDILGTAQTGTGKTAAFVLPIVETITATAARRPERGQSGARRKQGGRPDPRPADAKPTSLILTPTRELALQIEESVQTYGAGSGVRVVSLYGGASRNKQIDALRSWPNVVIATPGRLEDLASEGHISYGRVQYLVLDEADRMLDMGFIHAMRRIVGAVPTERQTALFSATMPKQIEQLAREFLIKPERVSAESGDVRVDRIKQSVMYVSKENKLDLLHELVTDRQMFRALVFTRTKHRARKVAKVLLKRNVDTDAIHGDKSQGARNRALEAFKTGKIQVLVATDVASRGIDVDDVTHVINFEIPNEPETYVHRIGRTARAGTDGEAISLVEESEMAYIGDIEKLLGSSIRVDDDQRYHERRKAAKPPQPTRSQPRNGGKGSGSRSNQTGSGSRSPRSSRPSRNRRSRRS